MSACIRPVETHSLMVDCEIPQVAGTSRHRGSRVELMGIVGGTLDGS